MKGYVTRGRDDFFPVTTELSRFDLLVVGLATALFCGFMVSGLAPALSLGESAFRLAITLLAGAASIACLRGFVLWGTEVQAEPDGASRRTHDLAALKAGSRSR